MQRRTSWLRTGGHARGFNDVRGRLQGYLDRQCIYAWVSSMPNTVLAFYSDLGAELIQMLREDALDRT